MFSLAELQRGDTSGEPYLDTSLHSIWLLEWIISIVPEMDGNILHNLGATSVKAGRRLSSDPLACLLTCSWVLVNIQGALT